MRLEQSPKDWKIDRNSKISEEEESRQSELQIDEISQNIEKRLEKTSSENSPANGSVKTLQKRITKSRPDNQT